MDGLTGSTDRSWHNWAVATTPPHIPSRNDLEQILAVLLDEELRLPADTRTDLVQTIENGLLPRIDGQPGPLNVVFVGPTGSGKSTLINSVAGRVVSSPGVLRPTTTRPLIYSQPDLEARVEKATVPYDHVSGSSPILDSISLIDTPDLDSTNLENRRRALDALSRADVVVFVTSALRYADLVPWEILVALSERGIPVIFVLNRISSGTAGVVTDFRRRARSAGMSFRVIRIEEHHLETGGMLPAASVRELRRAILSACSGRDIRAGYLASGFAYLSVKLAEMRHLLEAPSGSESTSSRMATPPFSHSDIEVLAAQWLGESGVGGVNRWSGEKVWRSRFSRTLDEIRAEIVGVVEQQLRMAGLVNGRPVVDLTDTVESHLARLDSLVDAWLESVGVPGRIKSLGYRHARSKVVLAVETVRIVFGTDRGTGSRAAVESARTLQSEIEDLFNDALRESSIGNICQAELLAIDGLIELLEREPVGRFAANA